MAALLKFLSGKKTYLSALGFVAMGIFQITQGQNERGLESITAALTVVGLRHAQAKSGG